MLVLRNLWQLCLLFLGMALATIIYGMTITSDNTDNQQLIIPMFGSHTSLSRWKPVGHMELRGMSQSVLGNTMVFLNVVNKCTKTIEG